jgi:hypothetical protein
MAMFLCLLLLATTVGVAVDDAASAEADIRELVARRDVDVEAMDDVVIALEDDAVADEEPLVAVLEAAEGESIELKS